MDASEKMAKFNHLYKNELTPVQRLLVGVFFIIQDFVAESPDDFLKMSIEEVVDMIRTFK